MYYMQKTIYGCLLLIAATCLPVNSQGFFERTFSKAEHEKSLLFSYGTNHRIPETILSRFQFGEMKFRYANITSQRNQTGYELRLMQDKGDVSIKTVAATINYRHYFLMRGNTAVSWDLGIGGMTMNDKFPGQATATNFIEQAGLTFQYGVGGDRALTFEYRYSHASNAGLQPPNRGINMSGFSFGYSWYR